jgi:hypothetical protein
MCIPTCRLILLRFGGIPTLSILHLSIPQCCDLFFAMRSPLRERHVMGSYPHEPVLVLSVYDALPRLENYVAMAFVISSTSFAGAMEKSTK